MTRSCVIVGCGGFGREVWAIVEALCAVGEPWQIEGFVDDSPSDSDRARVTALGSHIVGCVADLVERETPYSAIIAVGSPIARKRIHARLAPSLVEYPRLIHPHSTVGTHNVLGVGIVIAPGARLSTNITIGAHVQIDQNVTIGHDTTIGDFTRLNPQACVSGSVRIGTGSLVGAGATILQGLEVGADAVVGAGSCVVGHVKDGQTVKGIPAR